MKDEQNKIIKDLLNNKFDIEKFKEFTARVLNVKVANRKESEAVWEEFKEYIHSYQVISDYKDSEDKRIEIMVVKLNDERDPARAKVKQRNFIAKFLKHYHKEASLVAFYSDDNSIWKLSFVRLDYSFTFTGIEEKVTPSKRASYIVGEGEGNKTVIKQFSSLIGNENEVSLAQLENLFQLEKVTNEFFDEYKKKYLDLKEHLEKDQEFVKEALKHTEKVEDFSEEFAKKLMGQLAFLYFLQKKGWLGVKIIPQKLDEKDYLKIYSRASSSGKDLLDIAYRKKTDTEYKLRSSLDEKFDYNSLANCFKNTDFDKEWGTGEQKFIRTLFDIHKELNIKAETKGRPQKNFFNDYLEPMFYEALNYNRGDNQYFPLFNCKIPFLNGGLFEALDNYDWKNTDFHIPDEIFSNSKEAFDGDGILDVFDRFNFTINENEPSEMEVAVDPEMLGKVFENLLDVKDRKSKGAFYTPREIVHYMCKESLINYLSNEISEVEKKDFEQLLQMGEFTKDYDSRLFVEYKKGEKIGKDDWGLPRNLLKNVENVDKALASVKVADPAIGSGAFPLGMLTEIVKARSILTEYILMHEFFRLEKEDKKSEFYDLDRKIRRERSLYKLKLDTIENSLFGVDIEPSAVDIAKLRLWLSIVVDSPNDDIQPLPNLDFNLMVGNSLLDEFEGIKLFDEKLLEKDYKRKEKTNIGLQYSIFGGIEQQQEDLMEQIKKLHKNFFIEKDTDKKKEIKKDLNALEWNLIKLTLQSSGNSEKIKELEVLQKAKRKPYFLWKLEFAEVFKEKGGFDIVIGNPPYIGEKSNKEIFHDIKKSEFGRLFYQRRMDYFYFFMAKGILFLKEKGVLSYITTNYWVTATGGQNFLRPFLKKESNILNYIDFNEYKIFDTAMGQHNCIFLFEKNRNDKEKKTKVLKVIDCKSNVSIQDILYKENTIGVKRFLSQEQNKIYEEKTSNILFNELEDTGIIEKILKITKNKLEDVSIISGGVSSSADVVRDANLKHCSSEEREKNNISKGNGIFILSKQEVEELNLSLIENNYIKNYFKSSEIDKYICNIVPTRFLVYASHNNALEIEKTPNIYNHFKRYKSILEKRSQDIELEKAMEKGHWFVLTNGRNRIDFTQPKIVVPYRTKELKFAYNEVEWFAGRDVYYIVDVKIDIKYLLGYLNSSLIEYWLKKQGKRKGDILEIYPEPLKNIPLLIPEKEIETVIANKVNKILELKKLKMNTCALETEIDELIYDLYDLTDEEKEVVRNFGK